MTLRLSWEEVGDEVLLLLTGSNKTKNFKCIFEAFLKK